MAIRKIDKLCQNLASSGRRKIMATMNVSLPDPMREWIEDQIKTGRYANASDYMRDLIRRDQEAKDALIEALEKGAMSGVSRRTPDDAWKVAKARAKKHG